MLALPLLLFKKGREGQGCVVDEVPRVPIGNGKTRGWQYQEGMFWAGVEEHPPSLSTEKLLKGFIGLRIPRSRGLHQMVVC